MTSAILVAAGSGQRMGADIPKQFIEINGQSILAHTLLGFVDSNLFDEIVIVLSSDFIIEGEKLQVANPDINIKICVGGKERFHSVQLALQSVNQNCKTVFIHDAVRPFFSKSLLQNCIATCTTYGSAIPAIPLNDSIRKIENGKSNAVDRTLFRRIQTPQVFNFEKLKNAYTKAFSESFTDDAAVYEHAGNPIHLCDGEFGNFKITTPEDLEFAKIRLAKS